MQAHGLSKDYGRGRGVFDLDFQVAEGEVFAFLGPNGAGKTTTIRLALDLIRPSAGSLSIFGLDARRDAVAIHRRIGYLPGDLRLYERLTGRQLITHFAALRGMDGITPAEELAQRLDLDLGVQIRALSRGNRQKVGLVQALMHRPQLLVLDEPTSGLDPLVQQVFHELIREITAEGRTVFLSSHVLSEVQHVADRVALLRDGRLALLQSVVRLRALAYTRVQATFRTTAPPPEAFAGLAGVQEMQRRGPTVLFALTGEADPLIKALAQHEVEALESHEADLEDVFLDLYRGTDEERGGAVRTSGGDGREGEGDGRTAGGTVTHAG